MLERATLTIATAPPQPDCSKGHRLNSVARSRAGDMILATRPVPLHACVYGPVFVSCGGVETLWRRALAGGKHVLQDHCNP
jgi:hypothetical protein